MKLVVGGDHAESQPKGVVIKLRQSWKHSAKDCGSFDPKLVGFPDIATLVCDEIKSGRTERGVMVCGTGVSAASAGRPRWPRIRPGRNDHTNGPFPYFCPR